MKIKFDSDDNVPLNKPLKPHNMTITIKSVFEEDGVRKTLSTSFSKWCFVWIKRIKTASCKQHKKCCNTAELIF